MTDTLIARLEAATEGSRELSEAVLVALRWTRVPDIDEPGFVDDDWRSPFGERLYPSPDPTRSLDDALALVPEVWCWQVGNFDFDRRRPGVARVGKNHNDMLDRQSVMAATPALALCAALLRATGGDHAR